MLCLSFQERRTRCFHHGNQTLNISVTKQLMIYVGVLFLDLVVSVELTICYSLNLRVTAYGKSMIFGMMYFIFNFPENIYMSDSTNMSSMTDATCGAVSAYTSATSKITTSFVGFVLLSLVFSMLCFVYYGLSVCIIFFSCDLISLFLRLMTLNVPLVSFACLFKKCHFNSKFASHYKIYKNVRHIYV